MHNEDTKDIRLIAKLLLWAIGAGLVAIILHLLLVKNFSLSPLLWALAFLISGGGIGFLFGVPRILFSDTDSNNLQPSNGAGNRVSRQGTYRPSTHFDRISEWVTTLIVGLTLVQWENVVKSFDAATYFIAFGLSQHPSNAVDIEQLRPFVASVMIYFSFLGFLGSYLVTRIYLSRVFEKTDVGLPLDQGEKSQFNKVDLSDLRTLGQKFGLRNVAEQIDKYRLTDLLSLEDITAWAKAQLILQNYEKAVEGYKRAVEISPADIQLRLEYTNALYYAGKSTIDAARQAQSRGESEAQLLKAYSLLNINSDPVTKMKVYRAITFFYLYSPPPNGFENTIKFGEEYVNNQDPQNIPSGGIWVNLACAYGQKYGWLLEHGSDQKDLGNTREKALHAITEALKLDQNGRWLSRLRDLMLGTDPADSDLAVFRNDPHFNDLLGLHEPSNTNDNQ